MPHSECVLSPDWADALSCRVEGGYAHPTLTGVGVAPLFVVVSQPVMENHTTSIWRRGMVVGAWDVMTQEPVGGAGWVGKGTSDG